MIQHDLDVRFTYHKPQPGQAERYVLIRDKAKEFAELINKECPDSRELSLAMTNLEQAAMWANASAAMAQRGLRDQSSMCSDPNENRMRREASLSSV